MPDLLREDGFLETISDSGMAALTLDYWLSTLIGDLLKLSRPAYEFSSEICLVGYFYGMTSASSASDISFSSLSVDEFKLFRWNYFCCSWALSSISSINLSKILWSPSFFASRISVTLFLVLVFIWRLSLSNSLSSWLIRYSSLRFDRRSLEFWMLYFDGLPPDFSLKYFWE